MARSALRSEAFRDASATSELSPLEASGFSLRHAPDVAATSGGLPRGARPGTIEAGMARAGLGADAASVNTGRDCEPRSFRPGRPHA
jgi:hypothetical protein